MQQLEIKNLRVAIGENEIVRDLSLAIRPGEVHAIMGPNGSGKSTLAKVIAGYPDYEVIAGEVIMDGENILQLEADVFAPADEFIINWWKSFRALMAARITGGNLNSIARR